MQKQKVSLKHSNGSFEGIYINAGENSRLVIIANGHNGFYNYGMFPYIQESFYKSGISSYSFNYSHGGVIGASDIFEDIEKYEKNCMRLEKEDILCALKYSKSNMFLKHQKTFILTHSLGGVPTIFATKEAEKSKIKIDGIILVSTIKTLNVWGKAMMDKWQADGIYLMNNNRTNQDLPQGKEFLEEVLNSESEWNIENTIKQIKTPILIVHGEKDEAVPTEHSKTLFSWVEVKNSKNELKIIDNATHTFNTKHPFVESTKELRNLIIECVKWMKKI